MRQRLVQIGSRRLLYRKLLDGLKTLDWLQIFPAVVLLAIGLAFIYSTGRQIGSPEAAQFWIRQLQWVVLGGGAWLILTLIDYRTLRVWTPLIYLLCVLLLTITLFYGVRLGGARRWLLIPLFNIRIQPSEFTKLALVLLISAILSVPMANVNKIRYWGGCLLLSLLPFVLIVAEPDLGSAVILLPPVFAILFISGFKWRFIAVFVLSVMFLLTAGVVNEKMQIYPLLKEYQKERILTFLDAERDISHRGYNQFQARLAVGSGGAWGKGFGQGTQHTLGFLPQSVSNNDFIFSVIAEETGFAGGAVLVVMYFILLCSILRTAFLSGDTFGRLVAGGLAVIFFSHSFVNLGMSIGLSPVTGLCLPLVSYGGSFMLFAMCGLGIMQSIYRQRIIE